MDLVDKPQGTVEEYNLLWAKAMMKTYQAINDFEKECSTAIDKEFFHTLALHTQVVKKASEICYQHGRILYAALRKYLRNTKNRGANIIETGTARGFSAICMAKAIDDIGYKDCTIKTIDVLSHTDERWWNCIDDTEGKKSRAQLLVPWTNWTKYITFITGDVIKALVPNLPERVHFAFLDSGHTYDVVRHEIKHISPRQQKGDIVVFDDYTPAMFPEVVKAIDRSCDEFKYGKKVITANNQRAYVIATKG